MSLAYRRILRKCSSDSLTNDIAGIASPGEKTLQSALCGVLVESLQPGCSLERLGKCSVELCLLIDALKSLIDCAGRQVALA
jgi:hypothetical protein